MVSLLVWPGFGPARAGYARFRLQPGAIPLSGYGQGSHQLPLHHAGDSTDLGVREAPTQPGLVFRRQFLGDGDGFEDDSLDSLVCCHGVPSLGLLLLP